MVLEKFIKDSEFKKASERTTEIQRQRMRELLATFKKYVKSDKCRRIEILTYLGAAQEELAALTIRENCCDVCKRDLTNKIPLHLKYEELDENGNFDFTNDARIVLRAFDPRLTFREVADLLTGQLPTAQKHKFFKLKSYGEGRHKPHEWWKELIESLVTQKFLEFEGNLLVLAKLAKNFVRFKGRTLKLPPHNRIHKYLKERKDLDFFWENNVIKSKPKMNEPPRVTYYDDLEMDDELLIQACAQIEEEDDGWMLAADSDEIKQTDASPVTDILPDDDNDEWMLRAADTSESIATSSKSTVTSMISARTKSPNAQDLLKQSSSDSQITAFIRDTKDDAWMLAACNAVEDDFDMSMMKAIEQMEVEAAEPSNSKKRNRDDKDCNVQRKNPKKDVLVYFSDNSDS